MQNSTKEKKLKTNFTFLKGFKIPQTFSPENSTEIVFPKRNKINQVILKAQLRRLMSGKSSTRKF
jgi:hypothetical protein